MPSQKRPVLAFHIDPIIAARMDAASAAYTLPLLVLAGLLVGFGTRLGSGCTSGHGVCGLARLSPRSMVATGVFMLMGMATVAVVRMMIGGGT